MRAVNEALRARALWERHGPSGAFAMEAERRGVLGWCWRKAMDGHTTEALAHMLGVQRRAVQRYLKRYTKATGLRVPRESFHREEQPSC